MITATELHAQGFKPPRTIEELRKYLQAAIEVEHLTIPVYMTGMYTIRPDTNRLAYYAIRSVVLEEMLHLTLAANLLNAVGGKPNVAHPEFVAEYPAKLPFSSDELPLIGLRHFSPKALDTFLTIERPRSLVPPEEGEGWTSIGQFYAAIADGLRALVEEKGEAAVFTGDPARQVGPEDFYNSGGEAFPIAGLKSALTAIEVISEQGEGADDSIWDSDDKFFGEERQLAHYFRFNEIRTGRSYGRHDTPRTPPSGPLLDVTWDDAYKIHGDSKVADYKEYEETSRVYEEAVAFNQCYATLLSYLDSAFDGWPRLMCLAVPTMLELGDRAERLYRNPHPDPALAKKGVCASATFELGVRHFDAAREQVEQNIEAVDRTPGAPIDLSAATMQKREQFA
ncbi:ferritin-like domain-containing protein [Nocardiopsis potens]|uniref:ferritin-like domain-containing protein n=1 Tax=Nocardiopsis potens TaxID=1246458 RepID=UPI00034C9786|nr:ferritin-like protein [Nocardiopsis potens]